MLIQLDTENADGDLTSLVTVLTHTPSTTHAMRCIAYIELGDGAKDLDATGGLFQLVVTVGGVSLEPSPQIFVLSAVARTIIQTKPFLVKANKEAVIKLLSPNGADTDVDVTAELYDDGATDAHLIKAALVNGASMGKTSSVSYIRMYSMSVQGMINSLNC